MHKYELLNKVLSLNIDEDYIIFTIAKSEKRENEDDDNGGTLWERFIYGRNQRKLISLF